MRGAYKTADGLLVFTSSLPSKLAASAMKTAAVLLSLCALSSVVDSRSVGDRALFFPMGDVMNTVVGGALSVGQAVGDGFIGAAEDAVEVGIDVFEQLAEQLLQANSLEATLMKCMASMGKLGAQAAEQVAKQVVDAMVRAVATALMQGQSPSAALDQGAGGVLGGLTGAAGQCLSDALLGVLGNLDGVVGGALGGATGALGGVLGGGVASDVTGNAGGAASDVAGGLTSGLGGGSGSSGVVSGAVPSATGSAGGVLNGGSALGGLGKR